MKQKAHPQLARIGGLCIIATLSFLSNTLACAQTDLQVSDRATAERLTNAVVTLNLQYQTAAVSEKSQVLQELVKAATTRQEFLSSIMDSNPGEVIRVAIPSSIVASFPAPVKAAVEQEADIEGKLEVAIEDWTSEAKLHHFLNTGIERLELHFDGDPPANLLTGDRVRAHGVRVLNGLALTSGSTTSTTTTTTSSTSILPNTLGAQKTLVILINFQDNISQPWTVANAQGVVFTTASNFWLENSVQQTWLTGDVAGWFTLPITSTGTSCDSTFLSSIQANAQQAAQNAGYTLSNYNRFLYAFPQTSGCSWLGYSYIGGSPSNSWANGYFNLQVVSHELGHALGLYHSHALGCGSVVYAPSGCSQYEYGDYYDIMGNSNPMDYNSFQRERLGWLNNGAQPPIMTVTSSGTYQISPFEAQDGTTKALKVAQSSTSGAYYYVESRKALGFDNLLSFPEADFQNVLNGVIVHLASLGNANSSDLLNMNPASAWGTAMALDVGQSYTDSTAGITISTTAVSSSGATVQVTVSGPICTHADPTVNITPSQSQWVTSGATVNFTFSVTNNDSSGCSSATFNLGDSVPSGWSGGLSSSFLSLAPGSSGSATLQATSPVGTANGFYSVSASATNSSATSYAASISATYVISTPSITVSINQTGYSRGQTVGVTVTLMSGNAADSGANVTVNITKSNGSVVMLTGTTGSNGAAVLSYKLKKTDPVGTYRVTASSSGGGNSATISAATSFSVQ